SPLSPLNPSFSLGGTRPHFCGSSPVEEKRVFFIFSYETPFFGGDSRLVVTTSKISRKSGLFGVTTRVTTASPPAPFPRCGGDAPMTSTEECDPWSD
ncbi:MAG: hypothetical protein ACR2OO_10160, partial [Thermomicrobiales bacterium]